MKRSVGPFVVVTVLTASTAFAFGTRDGAMRRQFININAACPAQGPTAQIVPFQMTAAFGDTLAWHLNGPPSSQVTITPKSGQDWPFTATSHSASPAADAVTDGLRQSIPARGGRPARTFGVGDTIRYDVTVSCPDGRQAVIDPDIIIGGGP